MDLVANTINAINNALAVCKKQIVIYPYSDFVYRILELLKNEGYLNEVEKKGRLASKRIVATLKYEEDCKPVITKIKMVSKQGQRIYESAKALKNVKSGYGISIISTSQGLMTNKEARKRKLGGEVICQVW